MHLTELFDLSLRDRAARPALEYADGSGATATLTFAAIEARANRMAHELRARGCDAGDRLCIHIGNGPEFIDLYLACVRLGVIFVPVNVLYRERELRHIVADAEPRAVVVQSGTDAVYPDGATLWPLEDVAAHAATQPADRVLAGADEETPALIVYTSGTTGAAKGAVLSHGNLMANARNLMECWRITETDRYLAVLPLFHVHGLANGLHAWLASGCRMRLCERFDQGLAAGWFRELRPTLFFGVPTIYVRLLDPAVVPDADARAIGSHARLFVSGSAPLPSHVFQAFQQRFGHAILERYGMSEALMITSNPCEGERRPGTVGQPLPGVSVRLASEDGAPVADGEVGELQIRSPALFSGYWRNSAATAAAFTPDRWFHTGDLGVRSADGYYSLVGRRHDVIISAGFNIYPAEIEQVLLEDARVREVTVVGVPDDVRGEVPVAYIVADQSLDPDELATACRRRLASFKTPRAFIRMSALPRTALGKVQKHLLPPWTPS